MDALGLRRALVDDLRASGAITRRETEAAFMAVPREIFVPHVSLEAAYRDHAIPFKFDAHGSAISSSSQPAIMALMLEQLDLRRDLRVLEVGAGSGYNAALLAELVGPHGSVTSIDIDPELALGARQRLALAGYERVDVVCADGLTAVSEGQRYDRILLTASSNEIAGAWIRALPEGGRIVLPLIFGLMQASVAFVKRNGALESDSVVPADFMMLRTLAATSTLTVLGGAPSIRVRTKGVAVDADALLRNLSRPAARIALEGRRPNMWALGLWIDLQDAQFARFAAHEAAAARGLVPSYGGSARSSEPFISTEGLCDGVNACLFRETLDERIELAGYGEAGALAARLQAHVLAWTAHGCPTQAQLQISASPARSEAIVRYRR